MSSKPFSRFSSSMASLLARDDEKEEILGRENASSMKQLQLRLEVKKIRKTLNTSAGRQKRCPP